MTDSGHTLDTARVRELIARLEAHTFPQCVCDRCVERRECAAALSLLLEERDRLAAPITAEMVAEAAGTNVNAAHIAVALNAARGTG